MTDEPKFDMAALGWIASKVAEYVCIFHKNLGRLPNDADVLHSALLCRLLSGKKALPQPPPLSFSYPNYALAEGEPVDVFDPPFDYQWDDQEPMVSLAGCPHFRWLDKKNGLLEHVPSKVQYRLTGKTLQRAEA